jgi:DNA anti-recombination protein RmuC
VSDDVNEDAGGERPDGERNPWRRDRPAPARDRLISWGQPPEDDQVDHDGAGADDPAADGGPAEAAPPVIPPPPPAPVVTAEPTLPPTVPRQQRHRPPPPPSSRAPGTFESLAPPVVEEPPAPPARRPVADVPDEEAPPRRSWASPTIAATPADERRGTRPARPEPTVSPRAGEPARPAARPSRSPEPSPPAPPPPPSAAPSAPAASAPGGPAPARPVSITELSHQLTAMQAQLAGLAGRGATADDERPPDRTEAGLRHLSKQLATLQAQLTGLGEHLSRAADGSGDRKASERTSAAVTELSQQLAATQAQVTSLSAQLSTLAHRVTYDLERGAQTTTERLVRDLPEAIASVLAAQLGPAIDDLTDQVEADRATFAGAIESLRAQVATLGGAVEGLPLSDVEVMSALKALEHDLEDRLARLSNRLTDQVATLERSNAAELVRVRDHVADLHDLMASPIADAETLDRMAGQVERLAQRAGGSGEVVDALELLIAEHLEVLRDEIEGRVGALAPLLQEELEAVRSEAVAGVGATEEALGERLDALEATLTERLDAALAEQLEGLDGLLADRLAPALDELATRAADDSSDDDGGDGDDHAVTDALAAVTEELQSLRRRITLRLETGDAPVGLSDGQLEELAERVAAKLRDADAGAAPTPAPPPPPRHAASRGRPARVAKRA